MAVVAMGFLSTAFSSASAKANDGARKERILGAACDLGCKGSEVVVLPRPRHAMAAPPTPTKNTRAALRDIPGDAVFVWASGAPGRLDLQVVQVDWKYELVTTMGRKPKQKKEIPMIK